MKIGKLSFYAVIMLFVFSLTSVVLTGCGGKDKYDKYDMSEDEEEEGGSGGVSVDLKDAGSLKGVITFEGTAPAPSPLSMGSDPVCSAKSASATNEFQDVCINDGKLGNVFVYISKGLEGKSFPDSALPKVEFDQDGCKYIPRVAGVVVDQEIVYKNSDATMHNVHATPTVNKGFNLAQPNAGMTAKKIFTKEEIMIPVSCDVHGWMRSYVGVCTHPCFATSGKDGAFTIKNVPPGDYTVTAWHEKFGKKEQTIKVAAKEAKDVNFAFKAQ